MDTMKSVLVKWDDSGCKIQYHCLEHDREKCGDDVSLFNGDLAGIDPLSRCDLCQEDLNQWKVIDTLGDPERCDALMVLSSVEGNLHHPLIIWEAAYKFTFPRGSINLTLSTTAN